jgi:Ribonuclease HI
MLEVWTDGAMRPIKIKAKKHESFGHSSIGIIIKKNGEVIKKISDYVGILDNNQAEYKAFIEALKIVLEMEENEVIFYTDSNLLEKQMNNKYGSYSEKINPYYLEAKKFLYMIPNYKIVLIPRGANRETDALTKKVLNDMNL